MRPRISQAEAQYVLEVLLATQKQLKGKYERLDYLRVEVRVLKQKLYGITEIREFKQKAQSLIKLEQEALTLIRALSLAEKLIKKYGAITRGNSRRGDYKHFSSMIEYTTFPKKEKTLQVLAE